MPRERAFALSRQGTRTITELANDYAHTYAPYIQAAVREVGHNYRQVAKWLTRERIPAQRNGQWKAQGVKNLVVRYWRLTGRRILIPYKRFPTPAHRYRRPATSGRIMCGGLTSALCHKQTLASN